VSVLADRCELVQARITSSPPLTGVAATARAIAGRLAAHVPPEMLVAEPEHHA
jgi:hypothetical protein